MEGVAPHFSRNDSSEMSHYHKLKTSSYDYDKGFPFFREPSEIGNFSLDEERQFHNDSHQLKNFFPPKDPRKCGFDLRHGYEKMIRKDENVKEYLDTLLSWIMMNKDKFSIQRQESGSEKKKQSNCEQSVSDDRNESAGLKFKLHGISTDFVCWRGLVTKLLCVPYETRDDFMLAVIKFRGTYYMCEFETEAKKHQKEQSTPKQEEMCAWGWKFEQYVTADKSEDEPDISSPVNNNACFCTVVRSRLESHSLVFGAEVDCEEPRKKTGNRYIELKTSRTIDTKRQHENFCKFKLIKWWAQSFLVGIPMVVCGFRDDNGVVQYLQNYHVKDMHTLVKDFVRQPWKPNVCFNFLKAFLDYVKANITEDNERCAYVFRWAPGQDMTCEKRIDDQEFNFLPQWYTSWNAWDRPI